MFPIYLFIYKVKPLFIENQDRHEYTCTPLILPDSFLHVFFSGKKQMKRLFFWLILVGFLFFTLFNKTVSAAALECCKRNAINSRDLYIPGEEDWRESIFSKMYCFTEQREAEFEGVCYYYFPWSFRSALFLPFSKSTSSFPHLSWLRSRKQDWAVSWHPKEYKSTRKRCILFCQATWILRPALGRHLLPDRVRSHPLGNRQGITKSWSLRGFYLICLVGCVNVGWGIVTNVFCSRWRTS